MGGVDLAEQCRAFPENIHDDMADAGLMASVEKLPFARWLVGINKAVYKWGLSGNGPRLVEQTGASCWFVYFAVGYSPEAAVLEDLNNGI